MSRVLNNFLFPQDPASQGWGPLPKAGSVGGSAWEEGGYLCTGGCPCCIFPAVKLQFSEATDPGAFINFKPTFNNNKLRNPGSCSLVSGIWQTSISGSGKTHRCFMRHISSPAPPFWRSNLTSPFGMQPTNKNKLSQITAGALGKSKGSSPCAYFNVLFYRLCMCQCVCECVVCTWTCMHWILCKVATIIIAGLCKSISSLIILEWFAHMMQAPGLSSQLVVPLWATNRLLNVFTLHVRHR